MIRTIQGHTVPALGFGTWELPPRRCRRAVADALAIGYRHIDTAEAYGNEEAVGQGMADSGVPREQIFVTTKVWRDHLAREAVIASAEASLRRLRTDYADLLLIHWPNEVVPLEETLAGFTTLQEGGKVRHVGVSNFPPSLLRRALELGPVFCNQVEYHPYLGQTALRDLAREHDLLLTAYCPLARAGVMRDKTLERIGKRYGKTTAQVALRWLLQQDNVAAIPKAASGGHRRANLDVFDFTLSDEEMRAIFALDRGERIIDPPFVADWER